MRAQAGGCGERSKCGGDGKERMGFERKCMTGGAGGRGVGVDRD